MDLCEVQNTQKSIFIPGITTLLLIQAGGGGIFINWTQFWFKCYNVHINVNNQSQIGNVFLQSRTLLSRVQKSRSGINKIAITGCGTSLGKLIFNIYPFSPSLETTTTHTNLQVKLAQQISFLHLLFHRWRDFLPFLTNL